LQGDKVAITWKSWLSEGARQIFLKDFSPTAASYKGGNGAFQNFAWFFFFLWVISSLLYKIWYPLFYLGNFVSAPLILLSLLAYFFKKDSFTMFQNKNGDNVLWIRMDADPAVAKFIEELKKRIESDS